MRDRFGSWAYEPVALDALGLSWPKLQALQAEVKHLISQHAEAALTVTTLESGRQAAREQDLDAGATALRAGSSVPPPKAEPALEKKLSGARRTRDAFERATSAAIGDLETFKRRNASSLEADAARSLGVLRRTLADSARKTAGLYAEASSAAQSVKKLSPPVAPPAETGPPGSGEAARSTVFASQFVATTSQRSAGPDRGTIERVLNHLTSGLA
jgi:hypothetical protein